MAINATLKIADSSFDILHCKCGFRKETDSKGYPMGGALGGDIFISLESTEETLLLEKLLTKDPVPISGSLEFWNENEASRIRRLDWSEAYIYSVGETMQNSSGLPMIMTLKITPLRLDINRDIRIDRRFPKTYGFWWEEYKPEEEAEIVQTTEEKVMVRTLDGSDSGYVNEKLKYKVTGYNIYPTDTDRKNVKWKIKIDKKEIDLEQQGEEIELKLKPDWLEKTIVVMPYLDSPTVDVSHETEVKRFKTRFFARSKNWAGKTPDRRISEDMTYGKKTPEEVLKINRLFGIQLNASDKELFTEMRLLASAGSIKDGNDNSQALVSHFRKNTGKTFSSAYMDKRLKNHPTFKEFVYGTGKTDELGVIELLCDLLKKK